MARGRGLQDYEIDEVCSRVWELVVERIGSYQTTGVPYLVWLKRVADNLIKQMQREKLRELRRTVPLDNDFDVEDASDWGADPLLRLLEAEDEREAAQRRQELQEAVRDIVRQLSADSREVLQAREELGFSASEAADLLGWKVEKVYSEYYRAKKRVRDALLETYGNERVAHWMGKRPRDFAE
jgi:RNA polymerase sigma factor (sigma-70 family)